MAKRGVKSSGSLDAFAYLESPEAFSAKPVCVLFGKETFLQHLVRDQIRAEVLGEDDREFSLTSYEGKTADFAEVVRDLSTMSMFGSDNRIVEIDGADPFVTKNRADLEGYVESPGGAGVLLLFLDSFPANTRLYKMVVERGLAVDCKPATTDRAATWIKTWAKKRHRVQITPGVARLLVDIVGPELGLLDQELAKLALVAGEKGTVSEELVYKMVGSWRAKTAWDMLDMALEGRLKEAMTQLDRLLLGGEQPVAVLGQIAATLRKLAAATRIVLRTEALGDKPNLAAALREAGIPGFVVDKATQQLRRLGRGRAKELYRRLLEADLGMKGKSALPPRVVLERLLFWLAAPQSGVRA